MSAAPTAPTTAEQPVPVTFVTPSLERGGAEAYLETLLERLGPAWVEQVVALADGPARDRFAALGHPFAVLPTSARLGVLSGAWRLRATLAARRPAVVHANGVKAALVAVIATAGMRLPVVWVKHDFSWDGPLARLVGPRCRMVVGVSHAVTAVFDGSGVDVRVVPNGLPPGAGDVDRAAGRARLLDAAGLDDDAETVVVVGRLETGKGQLDLVEALPRIVAARPRARVVLVGPPSRFEPDYERRLVERAAALGVAHALTLLGHRADALELTAGADVAAVTSHPYTVPGTGEGFGLVAAEALAAGTPVVAYGHGGLLDVVGDAGLLVPPGDVRALADLTVRLLADPLLRERYGACGRERARRFDLAAQADAMAAIYREAAAAR